ncbi:MAG: hypothetical protein NVS4B6_32030 [Mycobacterium sp.]
MRFPPATHLVVMVSGEQHHAEAVQADIADVLAQMGLRLSEQKTKIAHVDEGFDFLGWRIQRHTQTGGHKRYVYTYPSTKAFASVKDKVRTISRQARNMPLAVILHRMNSVLRGWTNYFRPGVSSRTFNYLRSFTWRRVVAWLRRKHPKLSWAQLRRRYLPRWWPTDGTVTLFNPGAVHTTRYHYRGAAIPTPWTIPTPTNPSSSLAESRMR